MGLVYMYSWCSHKPSCICAAILVAGSLCLAWIFGLAHKSDRPFVLQRTKRRDRFSRTLLYLREVVSFSPTTPSCRSPEGCPSNRLRDRCDQLLRPGRAVVRAAPRWEGSPRLDARLLESNHLQNSITPVLVFGPVLAMQSVAPGSSLSSGKIVSPVDCVGAGLRDERATRAGNVGNAAKRIEYGPDVH